MNNKDVFPQNQEIRGSGNYTEYANFVDTLSENVVNPYQFQVHNAILGELKNATQSKSVRGNKLLFGLAPSTRNEDDSKAFITKSKLLIPVFKDLVNYLMPKNSTDGFYKTQSYASKRDLQYGSTDYTVGIKMPDGRTVEVCKTDSSATGESYMVMCIAKENEESIGHFSQKTREKENSSNGKTRESNVSKTKLLSIIDGWK